MGCDPSRVIKGTVVLVSKWLEDDEVNDIVTQNHWVSTAEPMGTFELAVLPKVLLQANDVTYINNSTLLVCVLYTQKIMYLVATTTSSY